VDAVRILAGITLTATLVASAGDCAQCDAARFVPCAPHLTEERDAIAAGERAWKDASAEERVEILRQVASSTESHANAPSARVAKFLARGVADGAPDVQRAALESLLRGQHPEEVVAALVVALDAARSAWEDLHGALAEHGKRGYSEDSWLTREEFQRWLAVLPHVQDVTAALGRLPDERARDALTKLLKWPMDETPGPFYVAACGALIEQGSAEGLGAVVDFLPRFEKAIERGKTGPSYRRTGPAAVTLLDAVKQLYRAGSAQDAQAIQELLAAAAADRGLPVPPSGGSARKGWLDAHRAAFAADLGRTTRPVATTLPPRVPDDG
jgi:hypothetical protein